MEKWKDEIIDSLKDIQKAQPPSDTFLKIQSKIKEQKADGRQWIAIAASIVMVLCANVFFISSYTSTEVTEDQSETYPSIVSNYSLYE